MRASIFVAAFAAGVTGAWSVGRGEDAPLAPPEITQLKPMYLETALAAEGRAACAIVLPADPAYLPLARKLAAAVQAACGVAPPIRAAEEVARQMPPGENLIALGVFANNKLVEDLYLREFVLCDYNWPGGQTSYVIRTVHNPWLNGRNAIYLGSTSLGGCQAAVERFSAILAGARQGSVGPLSEVLKDGQAPQALTEKQVAATRTEIQRTKNQESAYSQAAHCCNEYFITGQPAWGRLFLEALRKIDALHRTQSEFAVPSNCQSLFQWFDCIEEGSAFSDQDRLELTNLLARFAARLPEAKTPRKPLTQSVGNWPMAAAFAALYFSRYYPDLELSRRLLANAQAFYEPDMRNWKPPEDSPYYANITVSRSIRWALCRPDRRYVDQGQYKRIADYYMLISNNLGELSGFGDCVGLGRERNLVESFPLAAWLYGDGRLLWWWDHFAEDPLAPGTGFHRHRGQGLMGWVPPDVLPRKRPDDLLGIASAPLDPWIYQRRDLAQFLGHTYEESHGFPIEACYDKVTFRAGFDRQDQYLCLSGIGWGYHGHPHANAIVNYTDQGRPMLYDNGYMVAQPSEHNTLIVLKEGRSGGIPELAQVVARAEFPCSDSGPGLGLFVSRLNNYNGLRWDRAILWSRARYFLVIDDLEARQPGHYNFQCIWRALGQTDLEGRRWTSDNPPGRFHLVACSDFRLAQKPSAGTSLNAPPFPLDKARRLVESASAELQPGQGRQLANLFYSTPDSGKTYRVEACRLDQAPAYLVEDDGQLALAGVQRCDAIRDFSVQGAAFHLLRDRLSVAGARCITCGGPLLQADVPVNVQIDLHTGEAQVEVNTPAQVTLATAGQANRTQRLDPGTHHLQVRPVPEATLRQMGQELRAAFTRLSTAAAANSPPPGSGQRIRRLWQYPTATSAADVEAAAKSPHPNAVRVADVDGRQEVIVAGADHAVHAVATDGRRLWRHELPGTILDLNLSGGKPGTRHILAGCDDGRVYALEADGSPAWSALPPARSYARSGYHEGDLAVHQGQPVVVFGADLDGDGNREVIVGSNNGILYALDSAGKLLWDALSHTPHTMTCGTACDLNGDGRQELIMGNIYAYAQIFSADGQLVGRSGGAEHAGAVVVAAGNLSRHGQGQIAVGDKLGQIFLQKAPATGPWSASQNTRKYNTGSDITAVALADVDGDGQLETVAASRNFLLYLFDADRQLRWQLDLGDACLDLDLADVAGDGRPEILCACEDGTLKVIDAGGRMIAWYQASAAVQSVRACELDGRAETREIVAGCADGSVVALQVVGP